MASIQTSLRHPPRSASDNEIVSLIGDSVSLPSLRLRSIISCYESVDEIGRPISMNAQLSMVSNRQSFLFAGSSFAATCLSKPTPASVDRIPNHHAILDRFPPSLLSHSIATRAAMPSVVLAPPAAPRSRLLGTCLSFSTVNGIRTWSP